MMKYATFFRKLATVKQLKWTKNLNTRTIGVYQPYNADVYWFSVINQEEQYIPIKL